MRGRGEASGAAERAEERMGEEHPKASGRAPGEGARLERLRAAVGRIRVRRGGMPLTRALAAGGAALLVLGLGAIGLGWYGASRTPYLFEQVPYLISGGLVGLGLAIVGAGMYFAYWLTRLHQETREQGRRAADVLERIEGLLAAGTATPNGARAPEAPAPLVATAKGTMFHRPDCAVVAGRKDVRTVRGDEAGLEPCRLCDPLAVA